MQTFSFEMRRRSYQIQGKVHIHLREEEDDAFIKFTTKHKLNDPNKILGVEFKSDDDYK